MIALPVEGGPLPHEFALRLAGLPGLTWLDGGLEHGQEGRHSFVGVAPCQIVERSWGEAAPLAALDALAPPAAGQAASSLPEGLAAEDVPHWIGHIAYDAAWMHLPGARLARHPSVPCLRFARYDALYAFDHQRGTGVVVGDSEEACRRLLARADAGRAPSLAFAAGPLEVTSAARHGENVRSALERIRAGDVYEVNLARRYRAAFQGSPLGLFLRMRTLSPVPLGYFAQADGHAVLGRSMERFLRYRARDRLLWTSPIKGTIAHRGDQAGEASALLRDPKEHAEHAMVVDLMRNDLSRVCVAGSVQVRELMRVLPFAGLSHLVSTIEGRVAPGRSVREIVEGTFPPGSITGAPKRSAMQVIEALEEAARGIYTGAVGFVDRAGGCSLAVAIRTAVVHAGVVDYFAGGGIVIDSDPERETHETDLKAQVFVRALRELR